MDKPTSGVIIVETTQDQIGRIKREVRWLRRLVGILIAVMALAFLSGQSSKRRERPVKVRSAQEFILKDADGRMAGRWFLKEGKHPAFEMYQPGAENSSIGLALNPDGEHVDMLLRHGFGENVNACVMSAGRDGVIIVLAKGGDVTWQAP